MESLHPLTTPRKDLLMTNGNPDPATEIDPALHALNRLVGTWQITGDATGTVTYRWLPGHHFLVQEGELELFGHRNRFIEIIGRLKPFGGASSTDIHSRTYTSTGDTLDYIYEIQGDTLTIWGGHRDSESAFRGTFADQDHTLTGDWTWPGGGYTTTSTRLPADEATEPAID